MYLIKKPHVITGKVLKNKRKSIYMKIYTFIKFDIKFIRNVSCNDNIVEKELRLYE